jgi:UDP-3-O-[3-hydroxymyristoyl] glucosamine N-acyltransferase
VDNQVIIEVTTYSLARVLGLGAVGPDLPIRSIAPLSMLSEDCLCFSKRPLVDPLSDRVTVICADPKNAGTASVIVSPVPRLDFARALAWIDDNNGIAKPRVPPIIHPTAKVGNNVFIGDGAIIGAYTVIHHNVVIGGPVSIGERCIIKSCAVIGEDGFGFERDEEGIPIRLVHLGGVLIGDDVEIGSLTTICRGTLGDTVIDDHVKVDDHVHIAHNVRLRRGAMVIACAEVSGGVDVGENAWVGPNSSIIQQLKVGGGALIGIGANVIRDVEPGSTVAGNPAKPIGLR